MVAWYAPELPLPYGPDGYGGLPGIILRLDKNAVSTVITKLELSTNNNLTIELPKASTVISENEYKALTKRIFDNKKDQ